MTTGRINQVTIIGINNHLAVHTKLCYKFCKQTNDLPINLSKVYEDQTTKTMLTIDDFMCRQTSEHVVQISHWRSCHNSRIWILTKFLRWFFINQMTSRITFFQADVSVNLILKAPKRKESWGLDHKPTLQLVLSS